MTELIELLSKYLKEHKDILKIEIIREKNSIKIERDEVD